MLSQSGVPGLCMHDRLYKVNLQFRAADCHGYVMQQPQATLPRQFWPGNLGQVRQADRRRSQPRMSLRAADCCQHVMHRTQATLAKCVKQREGAVRPVFVSVRATDLYHHAMHRPQVTLGK